MNAIKNAKSSKIKLISTQKKNQNIIQSNKFKGQLPTKIKNCINDDKNLSIKTNENSSFKPLTIKSNPDKKYVLISERNSTQENYNLLNEISTKASDSSWEEKLGRKMQTPLNLTDRFNNIKSLLEKNLKIAFNSSLKNYINSRPFTKYNKNYLIEEIKNRNKNSEIKKGIINKDSNYKKELNLMNKNPKISTQLKTIYQIKGIKNSENNEYSQNIKNSENLEKNNTIFVKYKSCNSFKTASSNRNKRIIRIQDNNNNIKSKNNECCPYIKVNKKK